RPAQPHRCHPPPRRKACPRGQLLRQPQPDQRGRRQPAVRRRGSLGYGSQGWRAQLRDPLRHRAGDDDRHHGGRREREPAGGRVSSGGLRQAQHDAAWFAKLTPARPGPVEGRAQEGISRTVRLPPPAPSGIPRRMAILSDRWIRNEVRHSGMIEPFVEHQKREGVISYGLSSYVDDARVADEFKTFTSVDDAVVDPKASSGNSFVDRKTDVCVIPPNSCVLARTVEYFRIPRDVLVICLGKSTYA